MRSEIDFMLDLGIVYMFTGDRIWKHKVLDTCN